MASFMRLYGLQYRNLHSNIFINRLTVSPNAFGTAYGILQGFCNFSQTVFPIIIGQLIDTAPTKMIGFHRVNYIILIK